MLSTRQFKVIAIDNHRNGISGIPFHLVLFQLAEDEDVGKDVMLGIVFPEGGAVAVLSVNKLVTGDIRFASNSWRGDWFESGLRDLCKKYDDDRFTHYKPYDRDKETKQIEKILKKMKKALGGV